MGEFIINHEDFTGCPSGNQALLEAFARNWHSNGKIIYKWHIFKHAMLIAVG
jgi:hypothetical protein